MPLSKGSISGYSSRIAAPPGGMAAILAVLACGLASVMLEPVSKPMPRLTLVGAGNERPPAGQPSPDSECRPCPRMLSLDAHGRVLDWMSWQDAACLYVRGAVAWTLGDPCLTVHGGTCRATGAAERASTCIRSSPPRGHAHPHALDPTPALTNAALFARDGYLCMYCGHEYSRART